MKKYWLIGIVLIALLSVGFYPGGSADQEDFPLIYIDADAGDGGVGSQADPYNDFADINWTTGGDNSIYDYLDGTPSQSPTIYLAEGDEWREQLTVGCSGTATYPIVLDSYGSGAKPIINGADVVSTWTEASDSEAWPDSYTMTTDTTGDRGLRVRIPADSLSANGTQVRVNFEAHSSSDTTIVDAYIGEQASSGDNYDMESGTITRLTFDTGNTGCTITAGTTKYSDWVDYSFDKTKCYLISFGVSDNRRYTDGSAGYTYFKASASGESATANVTGYSGTTFVFHVVDIEVQASYSNVWKATLATEPDIVFFDGTRGTKAANVAAIDAAGEWFWDSNVLYIYYTEDPDGAVVIEAAIRSYCIYGYDKDYITIEDLEIKNAEQTGIKTDTGDNWIIDGVTAHHCGVYEETTDDNIALSNSDNSVVQNCTAYDGGSHNIFIWGGNNNIIQNNTAYNGHHASIDVQGGADGDGADGNIIRYNLVYYTDGYGASNANSIYLDGYASYNLTNTEVYYNIIYNECSTYTHRCQIYADDGGGAYTNGTLWYNNVMYGIGAGLSVNCDVSSVTIKNNIAVGTTSSYGVLRVVDSTNKTIDNNLWHVDSGVVCYVDDQTGGDGPGFTEAEWSSYKTESGFDANSPTPSDPLMTDPGNDDFTLNPHSLCVNAGTAVGLTQDYLGLKIRHAPDIGAYENQTNAIFHQALLIMRVLEEEKRLRQ